MGARHLTRQAQAEAHRLEELLRRTRCWKAVYWQPRAPLAHLPSYIRDTLDLCRSSAAGEESGRAAQPHHLLGVGEEHHDDDDAQPHQIEEHHHGDDGHERVSKRSRHEESKPSSIAADAAAVSVVRVTSLPKHCTAGDLHAFGERFGKVASVELIQPTGSELSLSTVSGLVHFRRAQEAATVMLQFAKVKEGLASPAERGQFRIRKQPVVCELHFT